MIFRNIVIYTTDLVQRFDRRNLALLTQLLDKRGLFQTYCTGSDERAVVVSAGRRKLPIALQKRLQVKGGESLVADARRKLMIEPQNPRKTTP